MEGDSRNPRVSLLKKYDIPVEHLTYEYVEKCTNKKELERIIRILRSGEEGNYPDLLRNTEERLRLFAPESRVLRIETPVLTKECLTKEEWDAVEKELKSWEEEMNIMDKSLDFEKGRVEVVGGSKSMPEVRKVVQPPKSKNLKDQAKTVNISENRQKIKSGDYAAWDKFDVDKELLKIDVEEEKKQEENEKKKREAKKLEQGRKIQIADVDKENYSLMEQQVLANQAKDRGNECYKSGDLENALKYYEISIKLYPTANAYNNRAMTHLKLKQYEIAIKDCNKVLHLEKNNIKALHRRATAYQNIPNEKENDYDQLALQDLYKVVQLEPNNKVAQADLQKLKKKLNIEDAGKKFRMPICEELFCKENSNQTDTIKSNYKIRDSNYSSTDKLPLTYYGPSTSTFQCEPHSIVHRQLSGSSILGEVLCKCNSNRPRQNPLCQKCGEAMCTPKSKKSSSAKSETKLNAKEKVEIKNQLLKQQANKIEAKSSADVSPVKKELGCYAENVSILNSNQVPEVSENNSLQEVKSVAIENDKNNINNNNSDNNNELNSNNSNSMTTQEVNHSKSSSINGEVNIENSIKFDAHKTSVKENHTDKSASDEIRFLNKEKLEKSIETVSNKSNEAIVTENSFSPTEINHILKKSKSKKKKTKDPKESKALRKHLEPFKVEPIKVVHAAKYLHPTSVEPKITNETSAEIRREPNLSSNVQYKAFVPNRKCYSTTEYKIMDSPAVRIQSLGPKAAFSVRDDKTNNDLSFEGNKENILENNCSSSNFENGEKESGTEEIKREFLNSGFEFMKTWEELKKFDESYTKRAEIIRKIKPGELSKVIGIKLDSEMLSCLLECLLRHFVENDPKSVIELLKQLPQVPRFGLVSMFLADADKKKMKKLIETAEGKGFKLDEDIKKNLMILS